MKVPRDPEEAAAPQPSSRRQGQRYASDKDTATYMGIGITTLWRLQNDIGSDGEPLPPPGHNFPRPSKFNGTTQRSGQGQEIQRHTKRNDLDAIDEWMRERQS